jgi:SagB-type dehydrogenase family enzyme
MKRKAWLLALLIGFLAAYASLEAASTSTGQRFIEQTKLSLLKVIGSIFTFRSEPPPFKEYTKATKIKLPSPTYKGLMLEEAIARRRSRRNYAKRPLTLAQLSQLLFAAQGITGEYRGRLLRSTPSAGALYPMEIYPVVHNISGLKPGIYHYAVREHSLEFIKAGDFHRQMTKACLDQEMAGDAQVTLVLSCIFIRVCYKYGERGYRYGLIEAGHIGQNIYLEATSLGLGAVAMGAFYDDKLNELLEIDGKNEAAIYVLAVGSQ